MDLLDRMVRAVERVRQRLQRTTAALEEAAIPYVVVGEQAVSVWVARADTAAVRNSPAIEILLNRSDLEAAQRALGRAGFTFRSVKGVDMFLDTPTAPTRDAVRIVFAAEPLRPDDRSTAPEIHESERGETFQVITLESLVKMKLTSFRTIDRVNVRDMIDVGLVNETWLTRLPAPLSERLKELLDDPEG